MPTNLELLKTVQWTCPKHPNYPDGVININVLKGAAQGCDNCLTAFLATFTAAFENGSPRGISPKDKEEDYITLDNASLPAAMTKKAREIGGLIGSQCPPGVGFALILFQVNSRYKEYISNGHREDMIRVFREMANCLEKGDMGEQHPRK